MCHRGYWQREVEQNSPEALVSAIKSGFSVELDFWNLAGGLVVSHDPPMGGEPGLVELLVEMLSVCSDESTIALNVKSSAMCSQLSRHGDFFRHPSLLFFDQPVYESLQYHDSGFSIALRMSDFEIPPMRLLDALPEPRSFWLDGLQSDWWLASPIDNSLLATSRFYVVSPEIHGRSPDEVWTWFKAGVAVGWDLVLCTDLPEDASRLLP